MRGRLVNELELGVRAALAVERESCARLARAFRIEVVSVRAAAAAIRDGGSTRACSPGDHKATLVPDEPGRRAPDANCWPHVFLGAGGEATPPIFVSTSG